MSSLKIDRDDFVNSILPVLDDFIFDEIDDVEPKLKQSRNVKMQITDYDNTSWGRLLNHPDISDPLSRQAREFRQRFRIPFRLFKDILVHQVEQQFH